MNQYIASYNFPCLYKKLRVIKHKNRIELLNIIIFIIYNQYTSSVSFWNIPKFRWVLSEKENS